MDSQQCQTSNIVCWLQWMELKLKLLYWRLDPVAVKLLLWKVSMRSSGEGNRSNYTFSMRAFHMEFKLSFKVIDSPRSKTVKSFHPCLNLAPKWLNEQWGLILFIMKMTFCVKLFVNYDKSKAIKSSHYLRSWFMAMSERNDQKTTFTQTTARCLPLNVRAAAVKSNQSLLIFTLRS